MEEKTAKKRLPGRPKTLSELDRRVMIGIKIKPRALQKLDRIARAQRRTRSAMAAILLEDSLADCNEPPATTDQETTED